MEELKSLLNQIDDSYEDFVSAMLHYAEKKTSRAEAVLNFIKTNSNARTEDVIKFVSCQSDFMEDAAYMRVG
ncbi:hypothetical protein ACTQ1U_15105 [Thermoguttaceae bacterium LCP21S3_D4]|nr:hypothetical protein [Lachnospiraceae bacterium]